MLKNRRRLTITQFLILLFVLLVVVVGVLYFFNNNQNSTSSSSSSSSAIQVINANNNQGEYKTVVKNGSYVTSAARGIAVTTEDGLNAQSFEQAINELSKKFFSTKKYIFQEGQYLSATTLNDWLDRYSSSNKLGLNPVNNGKTDNSRNPEYLQSIEENDFMTEASASNLNLAGMTMRIAMNRTDSYTKTTGGTTYTQSISKAEMVAQGKTIASKVLARLRANKKIGNNVPILIVMYQNASSSSLVGGVPYAYYMSKSGSKISAWHNLDYQNLIFPEQSTTTGSVGSQDNTNFVNFEDDIEGFFPTISSATAQARYEDKTLTGMKITVNTSFYSVSEIKAFSTYISEVGPKYFTKDIPITISVYASNQLLAVLSRSSGSNFKVTYLYSY